MNKQQLVLSQDSNTQKGSNFTCKQIPRPFQQDQLERQENCNSLQKVVKEAMVLAVVLSGVLLFVSSFLNCAILSRAQGEVL